MAELVILLGMGESGKTTYAKTLKNHERIDFDFLKPYGSVKRYNKAVMGVARMVNLLPKQNFVLDGYAYPFEGRFLGKEFSFLNSKLKHHKIQPVIICTDANTIVERVLKRGSPDDVNRDFVTWVYKEILEHFSVFDYECLFSHDNKFERIPRGRVMQVVSDVTMREVNEFLVSLASIKPEKRDNLEYDVFYQTIELPCGKSIKGYQNTEWEEGTWKGINSLVDWKGKTVADVGCLNGLYSFKIKEKLAKKVVGYDIFQQACDVATKIAKLKYSDISFKVLDISSQPLPEKYDIILLLNILHHCPNPIFTLENVFGNSNVAILESQFDAFDPHGEHKEFIYTKGWEKLIKNTDKCKKRDVIELAKKYEHSLVKEVKSARPNRSIMLFRRT